MTLNLDEITRLGYAAGENTATGAFQRLEQSVANWHDRNSDATDRDVSKFREAAERAFSARVSQWHPN